ncbi:hybrid sensor histidine kinase/response regulator [Dysgonomonas reticulitermitis]
MRSTFILILLFLTTLFAKGNERYYFSNLSLADGLSQITVSCIHQDAKGFMWFGTRNGLNRYDGYNFDIFLSDPDDNTSITDNHIISITEDREGNLWIGTNNGLNKFDMNTNKFKRFYVDSNNPKSLSHNTIYSVYADEEDNIWIGTETGLELYNKKTDSFSRILIDNKPIDNRINAILRKNDILYLGTLSKGLFLYNLKTKQCTVYKDAEGPYNIHSNQVKAIVIDKLGNLWVGTQTGGVSLLRKGDNKFIHYGQDKGLTNNNVRCISETPDGDILIGTFNGLNVLNPSTREIVQYKEYGIGQQGALSHYSIICAYYDRSQTLWVGTYAGGACYYNKYGQKFRYYNPNANQKRLLGIIGPMVETANELYIATEGGGLLEMNKRTGAFRNYVMHEGENATYGKNIIKAMYLDGSRIICGTNSGVIYSFDMAGKRFTQIYNLKEERSVYSISRSERGDLILGSVSLWGFIIVSDRGVKNVFPVKGGKDMYFSDVRCILEIQDDVFLIGTRNNGLYYYDCNTHIMKNYKNNPKENNPDNIPDNFVTNIMRDSNGNIWIGTYGGGISLFVLGKGKFTTYNTKSGLLNNNICKIVEDSDNHLWISTIAGISDFDPKTKTFRNYTHSNGIKIDEFTLHAGIRLANDEIIFSGNNGFVLFNPRRMSINPYIPPVILKNLFINNSLILPDGQDKILSEQLGSQTEIILNYDQSNISIEYSALNFIFSDRNQYAYKLEGFDKDWNNVGSRRMAYYTNVPPGEYRFVVKGSNNDGVWNNAGTGIRIVVKPPFWKTWWAYILYIAAVAAVIWFIIRYFTEKKRLQDNIRIKQLEAKTQEEFHQARDKLFTNFSHELRTPLTLIISPLDDMAVRDDLSPKVKENVLLMQSNARRLLRIVNNLMDFQKKESGTMKLKVSEGDFIKFSEEMVMFFRELALSRKINFVYCHNVESIQLWFDKSLMEKVFFNFLSNAFKNVPDKGSVEVEVDEMYLENLKEAYPLHSESFTNGSIPYIVLEIKDSGTGIAQDELEKIFIPFYQVAQNEHSASGTGLGLSLSKSIIGMHHGIIWAESPEGSGAIFRCILPVCKEYFGEEDFAEEAVVSDFPYSIDVLQAKKQEASKAKKTYTILVVEDNVDVRHYIISHLKDSYNIIEAANGEGAIEKAVNYMPDLIITDLMMPKMDGMEMCAIIKKDIRTSHIPVIMITARTMTEDMKQGYEAGADDYITKPFNSALLATRVDNIIQAREKLKELYGKRFSLETLGVEATSMDERFMQKLYEILEKNISNPDLSLDEFSRDVGMSRANLYRKIKSITDLSPNEFVRNFRLNMGAKLLKEARMPVSEVYVAVGFNSHAYFSNCFKTYYGVSPSEYAGKENDKLV